MNKDIMSKALVLSIIFLFIGVGIQPINAFTEIKSNNQGIIEVNNIESAVGLPDLIIEDIYYYLHDPGSPFYYVEADIKNQGDAYVYEGVTVEFTVVKTIFWFFNLKIIYDNIETKHFYGGLAPGETRTIFLSVGDFDLPIFGFFKFNAGINLDKKIDESNYNNNKFTEQVFCFFAMWF